MCDSKKYILFIDSGIGGLSILEHLHRKNGNLNILYYADVVHFPYGDKDEKTIGKYLLDIYDFMNSRYNIALIVIACNTASVSALNLLRSNVSIPVVGTVPAVKLAASVTKNHRIGVIATETTVRQGYIKQLVNDFASDKTVFISPTPKLASIIENDFENEQIKKIVFSELSFFDDKNIDTLVLGCTHYAFAGDIISEYFNGNVQLVDSREGITKRVISLIDNDFYEEKPLNILYMSSCSNKKTYLHFNSKFKIFNEIYCKDNQWEKA